MPPRVTKRPGDVTGRKAQLLAEEYKEEQKAREGEIALMTAEAAEERRETVDITPRSNEVQVGNSVEVEVPMKTFRVNTTLDMMTFGHGNNYDFEEGRVYKAPKYIYDHLEEKGFVWH